MRLGMLLGPVVLGIALSSVAVAANVLSVTDTVVDAGEIEVILPIELTSDRDLTRLRFDLKFDPAFCNTLDDPGGIGLAGTGRANVDPDDTIAIVCADGSIHVDMSDSTGAVVIPAGAGEIVEVNFGSLIATASGTFTFTPTNVLANDGATQLPLTVAAGTLRIRPPATTTTTTLTPGSTVTSTSTATNTSSTETSTSTSTSMTAPHGLTTSTAGVTTTTVLPPPTGCEGGANAKPTFAAVHCVLDALVAQADAEIEAGRISAASGRLLHRARAALDGAEARCAQANSRRARAGLRSVMRLVSVFRHRLGAPGRGRTPDDVRATLQAAADGVLFEARFLRGFVACPVS